MKIIFNKKAYSNRKEIVHNWATSFEKRQIFEFTFEPDIEYDLLRVLGGKKPKLYFKDFPETKKLKTKATFEIDMADERNKNVGFVIKYNQ